jgi:glycosyltransferase involved in cell wall biosynthesis
MGLGVSVVVPTLGRPSLAGLLDALAPADGVLAMPIELVLVDDRRDRSTPLPPVPPVLAPVTRVVAGTAAGPAAARNVGWRAASYPWVAFLDDDVVPGPDWLSRLADDLDVDDDVVGVQAVVEVPLPEHRPPTDWERVTGGLARAKWITADMAYRRDALAAVGGFDERFPRAYREDADVAYRLRRTGGRLTVGARRTVHPVRPESGWISLRTQRGNADDALLRRLYGPGWRELLDVEPGRRHRHALVTLTGVAALVSAAGAAALPGTGRRASGALAALAGAAWLTGTAELAAARIRPGPRTPAEIGRMLVTSAVIPPLAVGHWVRGWLRHRRALPWPRAHGRAPHAAGPPG